MRTSKTQDSIYTSKAEREARRTERSEHKDFADGSFHALQQHKGFSETEEKGKKIGKLRYKYGKFKSFMNQSGFKIETGSRLDRSTQR